MNAGFHRCKTRQVGILDDLILSDNTNRPAGKAPGDAAVVVDPLGNEFRLAAENPISFLLVEDAEPLVEPSLAGKSVDELLQDILRSLIGGISNRSVFRYHFVPISGLNQGAKLSPLYQEAFSRPPFHCKQKYRRSLPPVKQFQEFRNSHPSKGGFARVPGPGARAWCSKIMRHLLFHGAGGLPELRNADCGMRIEKENSKIRNSKSEI
jgi:hypothetical protein